ncbi:MAG: hypothetical protein WED10_04460 [Brumimicrobium sp.]
MKTLFLVALFSCVFSGLVFGQRDRDKKPLIQPSVIKSGPYFGIQQGEFTVGEVGGEMQFKRIRFKKPRTHGIHVGADYNIPNNVLGFSSGYWYKPGRFDFTLGADLGVRSNFTEERYGAGPVIGYKIFGFHIRAGYIFLTPSETFIKTNQLFINIRFILVNNRNFKWNKRKKEN